MTFWPLAALVTMGVFGVTVLLVGAAVAVLWPRLQASLATMAPETRASRLFAIRLFPGALGVAVSVGVSLPAFLVHEPSGRVETAGPLLLGLAGVGALLVLDGLRRGLLAALATSRLVQAWLRDSSPIQLRGARIPARLLRHAFPVVSVAGWLRPRLFVTEAVLEALSEDELRAVLAHEQAHLEAADRWRHLLLGACPDPLAWVRLGREIERHFGHACEVGADHRAARAAGGQALELASALVKVARLAPPDSGLALPAAALFRGDGLGERVRALLGPAVPAATSAAVARAAAAIVVVAWATLLAYAVVQPGVHTAIERLVHAFV